jgi:mRNA interferase MazF
VVLAEAGRGDWVLCQITSKPYGDTRAIELATTDLDNGALRITSYARPGKLFTANASLVTGEIGEILRAKFSIIQEAVVQLIRPTR